MHIEMVKVIVCSVPGADPGPVIGGGTSPSKGGANLIYFILFLKNLMKLKKFWCAGGHVLGKPPLDLPLCTVQYMLQLTMWCLIQNPWIRKYFGLWLQITRIFDLTCIETSIYSYFEL